MAVWVSRELVLPPTQKVCSTWIPPSWYALTQDRTVDLVHPVTLAASEREKPIAVKYTVSIFIWIRGCGW
ncbi:MAG: hypothetical protein M1318_05200 [Firmicutes bacterium]|nr:hypothetical protein [Bacillota bacterium]